MKAQQTQDGYWLGMLQRKSPRARSLGFVEEALNVALVGGVPVSRPGLRPFHGAAFPGIIRGMGWHVTEDGQRILLVASGSELFSCVEGGDPVELTLDDLPAAEQARVEPDRVNFLSLSGGTNTTFIYDGVNPNLKFDGTQLTRMGINTPPTAAAATDFGTGDLPAGVRNFVQTLISAHHESSPSTVPREVTTTVNQKFTITSPVRGTAADQFDDPQVTTWRAYMTVAGGSAFRFVDEADIGVDIVVDLTDTALAERDPVEFFVNDPPVGPAIALAEHRGQLAGVFAADRNIVRFSSLDPEYMVPEGWPEDFVQPVAHSDGDELTTLASLNEWLLCFKNNAAFAIVGDTFEEYIVVPVLAAAGGKRIGIGCFSPGTVLQVENALMFVSRDGIYKIDRYASPSGGITAERLSGPIDDLFAAAKFSLSGATFFDRIHRLFGHLGHG